jgi:HSP20 family protein
VCVCVCCARETFIMALRIHSFPNALLDDCFVHPRRRSNWDLANFGFGTDFHNSLSDSIIPTGGNLKVDVVEREKDFQVHVDLPAVDMKDVDLQVADGQLHLSAKREQVHEEKNEYSHRIERSFGQMKRSVPLPKSAMIETADAKYENGVLTVQFAKKPALEAAGPKKLAIRSGSTRDETSISGNSAVAATGESVNNSEKSSSAQATLSA